MIKKWKLLSKKDVSPSPWFPIEEREYELPDGRVVDDFTVTTLPDVAMIIPILKNGKVVMIRQYKPGIDEISLEFPAGRIEPEHKGITETAMAELEEEIGIKVKIEELKELGKLTGFPTKATEVVYTFLVTGCEFNSEQKLDETEEIEVLEFSPKEIDKMIEKREIWNALAIAGWTLYKKLI